MMDIQWTLVIYPVFAALSAGMFAAVGVADWCGRGRRLRLPGTIAALLALMISGVGCALQLGHPERIFGSFGNVHSGFSRGLLAATAMAAVLVVYLINLQRHNGISRLLSALAVICSIVMAAMFMDSYLVLPARPLWNSVMLPLTSLSSAAGLGLLAVGVLARLVDEEVSVVRAVGRLSAMALFAQAVTLAAYLAETAWAPFPGPSRSILRLLSGDLASVFWLLVVFAGLVIPLLAVKGGAAGSVGRSFVGLSGAIAGSIAFRVVASLMGNGASLLLR